MCLSGDERKQEAAACPLATSRPRPEKKRFQGFYKFIWAEMSTMISLRSQHSLKKGWMVLVRTRCPHWWRPQFCVGESLMQEKTHTVTLTQVSSCPSTEIYHHLQTEMHTLVLIQTGVISAAVWQGHSWAVGCRGPIYKQMSTFLIYIRNMVLTWLSSP